MVDVSNLAQNVNKIIEKIRSISPISNPRPPTPQIQVTIASKPPTLTKKLFTETNFDPNTEEDDLSPVAKKSLTPIHAKYRKVQFPLIYTQSINSPELNNEKILESTPKKLFFKTPSPQGIISAVRYSPKQNIFSVITKKQENFKRCNSERNVFVLSKQSSMIGEEYHERKLSEIIGDKSQKRYAEKIQKLKQIKEKTKNEVKRLRQKINSSKEFQKHSEYFNEELKDSNSEAKNEEASNKKGQVSVLKPPLTPNKIQKAQMDPERSLENNELKIVTII